MIVPGHETTDPRARLFKARKRPPRVFWPVLQRAKERLRIRIVVADPRTAVRSNHTEPLQRCALHGGSVVLVHNQPSAIDSLSLKSSLERRCCKLSAFALIHRPSDNLATPNVNMEIQIVESPRCLRAQIRDVPAPNVKRPRCYMLLRRLRPRRLRSAPMTHEPRLSKQAIKRRLGSHIAARICQLRHDLLRRKVPMLRTAC